MEKRVLFSRVFGDELSIKVTFVWRPEGSERAMGTARSVFGGF